MATFHITPREKEVLMWVADGKTAWEISTILHISEHTIRNHIENARKRFNAMNITHMVALALRGKVIE